MTNSRSERPRVGYTKRDLDNLLGCAVALGSLAVVLAGLREPPKQALAASRDSGALQSRSEGGQDASAPRLPATATLSRFRAELAKLAAHRLKEPLRILWIGDSHTAGISWPAAVESSLLHNVTSGGPGYIPLGLAYGRYHGARVAADDSFDIAPHPPAKRVTEDDGIFGLGGTRVTPRNKALSITIKLDASFISGDATAQLVYRYKAPTDRVAVNAGGKAFELKSETASFPGGVQVQRFPLNAQTAIDIRIVSGNPELFGLVVENDEPGLVVDVLGINGARFATPLAWDETAWTAQVRWRQPALAIIAYGTNEVFDLVSPKHYEAEIRALVGRIRAAAPGSECILAGPTDVGRGGQIAEERVREIDRVEAATADALGCAYFSSYEAMGGAQGFDEWLHTSPPLAVSDHIHLTSAGYRKLGQSMADSLFGSP